MGLVSPGICLHPSLRLLSSALGGGSYQLRTVEDGDPAFVPHAPPDTFPLTTQARFLVPTFSV